MQAGSERVRAAEALRHADRRKNEFLAILAHELRNPPAPIGNGLQVMRMAENDLPTVRRVPDMLLADIAACGRTGPSGLPRSA